MKKIMCDSCGDTHLVLKNGVYVCQSCGCMYDAEINVANKYATERNASYTDKLSQSQPAEWEKAETSHYYIGGMELTYDMYQDFLGMLRRGEKVQLIKQVREMTGLGLKEAKDIVDTIERDNMAEIHRGATGYAGARTAATGGGSTTTGSTDSTYRSTNPEKSTGGCYVATAVYGSYDCPQVWTLRRYRDLELAQTWYGRVFIRTYYAVSPTIVKWFGNTQWFNHMWKKRLDHMVADLQGRGYEDTPYEDRQW